MTENMDSITATLQKLIPTSLDDIVRAHRDECQLALATDEEMTRLATSIKSDEHVKHVLSHWQIIVMHLTIRDESQISPRLVGRLPDGGSWITSHVLAVDRQTGLVQTANSFYRVVDDPTSENELDLIFICVALNNWGIGQYLGVPDFIF